MDTHHPHFGATYRIMARSDAGFGIEVTIPGAQMVEVTGFATEELAVARIVNHEAEIAAGTKARSKLSLWKKSP